MEQYRLYSPGTVKSDALVLVADGSLCVLDKNGYGDLLRKTAPKGLGLGVFPFHFARENAPPRIRVVNCG